MYRCKHFKIEELVPPSIARDHGERSWQFLDQRALKTLDKLRDKFGKIIVNDYSFGGRNKYRGFRPHYCHVGAIQSQHRFGRAFDCTFMDLDSTSQERSESGVENNPDSTELHLPAVAGDEVRSVEDIRQYILDHPKEFRYINAVELDTPWLHFDVRNCDRILTFKQ